MPYKSFTAGSVLTAADVNDYLMEQSIVRVASYSGLAALNTTGVTFAWVEDEGILYHLFNGGWWAMTADYDTGGYISGVYYGPDIIGRSSTNGTLNRLYYTPFIVKNRITIDRLGVAVVTGAASTTARLGIYTNNPVTGLPQYLHTNAGAVSLPSSSTISTVTPASNITLNAGRYWLACRLEGTVTATLVGGQVNNLSGGMPYMGVTAYTATMPQTEYYDTNTTSGTLPSTASVNTAVSGTRSPIVLLRAV